MNRAHQKDVARAKDAEKSPFSRVLGQRIASLREARKWQRVHLARRLGVPRTRLGYWERGQSEPSLEMLLALGRILEVSIEELAGVDELTLPEPCRPGAHEKEM